LEILFGLSPIPVKALQVFCLGMIWSDNRCTFSLARPPVRSMRRIML
jgi:hypothetical protein